VKLPEMPFTTVDWTAMNATEHPGQTGTSLWRSFERDGLRTRLVEYLPGYTADHWCDRGRVLHVLSGQLKIKLRDGRSFHLGQGSGFCVSDHGDSAHLVTTSTGCRVFIVD